MDWEKAKNWTQNDLNQAFLTNEPPITTEEYLFLAKRYSLLNDALEKFLKDQPINLISAPDQAREALRGDFLRDKFLARQEELPQFAQQKEAPPDQTVAIDELKFFSDGLGEAIQKTRAPERTKKLRDLHASFINKLVGNYEQQTRRLIAEEQRQALENATANAANQKQFETLIKAQATKVAPEVLPQQHDDIIRQTLSLPEFSPLQTELKKNAVVNTLALQLVEDPRQNPTLVLRIAEEAIDSSPADSAQTIAAVATAHARRLEVLSSKVTDSLGTGNEVFFQAYAQGAQRLVAPLADAAFRLLPDPVRTQFIADRIQKTMEAAAEKAVDLPAFQEFLKKSQAHQIDARETARSGVSRVQNIIGDVTGFLFGSPENKFRAVFDQGKVIWVAIDPPQGFMNFHYAALQEKMPWLFHVAAGEAGKGAIKFGAKKLAGAAATKAASGLASKGLGALLGSLVAPGAGTLIGSVLIDKALSMVGGTIKAVGRFLSADWLTRLLTGTGGKTDWKKDWPLILAVVPIVALVVLFVFPTFLSLPFMSQITMDTALLPQRGQDSTPGATISPPLPPLENLAAGTCPVDGGWVSLGSYGWRGPNTGHGSTGYWGGGLPSYPIPILAMHPFPPCLFPLVCPYYGFAADVKSPSKSNPYPTIRVPRICDAASSSCADLTWSVTQGWYNCSGASVGSPSECSGEGWGYGYILTSAGNGHTWQLYLNHIDPAGGSLFGKTFSSAPPNNTVGSMTRDLSDSSGDSHTHIELNMDGRPVRPDFLCGGPGAQSAALSGPRLMCSPQQQILAIGDSITTPGGYPKELGAMMDGAAVSTISRPAENPKQIFEDLQGLSVGAPSVILLHVGTNGVNSTPDDNVRYTGEIINLIKQRSPATIILLAQIIKRFDNNGAYVSDVERFNDNIARFAGGNVRLVNMENVLTNALVPDDIHPSQEGYVKMAEEWKKAIDAALSACSTTQTPT